jgi:hypothetical protein
MAVDRRPRLDAWIGENGVGGWIALAAAYQRSGGVAKMAEGG